MRVVTHGERGADPGALEVRRGGEGERTSSIVHLSFAHLAGLSKSLPLSRPLAPVHSHCYARCACACSSHGDAPRRASRARGASRTRCGK
eukprot:5658859-Pleurochrysis_carterae.AAC.1